MTFLHRALFCVLVSILFTAPVSAQGECRVAAADAALLLDQARQALAEGDAAQTDALIAQARERLSEGCPNVVAPAAPTATPDPDATAAPTQEAASAGSFTVSVPDIGDADSVFFVRFANTGIDAGPLDFYVRGFGDAPMVANLAFGEATGLITLPTGNKTIVVRPAGSGGEPLSTLNWDFGGNSTWIVTAAGLTSTFAFIVEPLSIVRTPLNGKARVRVVNWVAGAERLSVSSDQGTSFGDGLGWVGMKDKEVEPGTYQLQIAGDSGPYGEPAAFDFAADTVYTLLIVGNKDGEPPVQFLALTTPQDQTRVRFVNNLGDAVDIHVRPGNAKLVDNMQPDGESDWFALPSVATTFVAYAPGTGPTGQEKAAVPLQLRPGRDVTIVLRGNGEMAVREETLTP